MLSRKNTGIPRREFLRKTTAFAAVAACGGPFFLFPHRAVTSRKKLRILQWKHFVPGYDRWFDQVFAKDWGLKYDTEVIVDHIALEEIHRQAALEIAAGSGHDLLMFGSPPASHENEVIDHREIYRELRRHWGEAIELAHKSTFNPYTKKYFAFCDSYIPAPFNWLKDLWTDAGLPFGPIDYDTLRRVGGEIRAKRGIPCGLGLAEELDSSISLYSVLWSFGGAVQDEQGQIILDSKNTIEALRYVKALYQETETPEMLQWKPLSNHKALLAGKISCTINAISTSRARERSKSESSHPIMISPALRAHSDSLAPPHVTQCYVIWNFAENKEGAKQFLIDLIGNFAQAFQASEFCNFASFPKTIPNLLSQLSNDPKAVPPGKYDVLRDTLFWTKNIGHPGYATSGVDRVFSSFVIPRMFARVARGDVSAQDSAQLAQSEVKAIFAK